MRKLFTVFLLTILGLAVSQAAIGQSDADARKGRILANLKMKYPQLAQANVVMNEIATGAFGSLDKGSFTINGQQTQNFLVSSDDKQLYFVTDPIDVSLDEGQIQAELARKEAEELAEAAERNKELEAAVAGHPYRGNPDAPVTIVEYSDFQCPYCARGAKTVDEILEKYPNDVKVVFQHFPLGFHQWAKPAAVAAHCAGLQNNDAFWSLHDDYFENQKAINPGNVIEKSKGFLAGSSIDMDAWTNCAENKESEEYKAAVAAVDAAMATGGKYGVTGTPGFFVNGRFLNGAQPLAKFEPLIAAAKKQAGS
ncbi:MAG: thioredoxin domain-containing protein [Acidobacteriota bacterium]